MQEDAKKPVFRSKPKSVKTHLTEDTKNKFLKIVKKNKTTVQAVLEDAVLKYLEEHGVSNE